MNRPIFLVGLTLSLACTTVMAQTTRPCVRATPRAPATGDTIRIPEPATIPCRLELVETGVVLRGDGAAIPDPGMSAAVDAQGRFFTSSKQGVLVWSPTGQFQRAVSRVAVNRTEFFPADMFLFVDHREQIHVLHGPGNWTVLSPALAIVDDAPALPIKADEWLSWVTGNGTFVSAIAASGKWFHLARVTDDTVWRFGDYVAAGGVASTKSDAHNRLVGYGGADAFWATSEPGSKFGYVLDLYGVDGTRRQTVERIAPWFPKGSGEPPQRNAYPPVLFAPHADTTGLLMTMTVMNVRSPTPPPTGAAPLANRAPMVTYIEVLDVRSGTVLASERFEAEGPSLVYGMFGGRLTGFRTTRSPDGRNEIRIVELKLTAK